MKPLNSYERVPYRGTLYVEAHALDEAGKHITALEASIKRLLSGEAFSEMKANLELTEAQLKDAAGEVETLMGNLKDLRVELDESKRNYESACKTVAEMHAAAVGKSGDGPILGVVEDVTALRAHMLALQSDKANLSSELQLAMARISELEAPRTNNAVAEDTEKAPNVGDFRGAKNETATDRADQA